MFHFICCTTNLQLIEASGARALRRKSTSKQSSGRRGWTTYQDFELSEREPSISSASSKPLLVQRQRKTSSGQVVPGVLVRYHQHRLARLSTNRTPAAMETNLGFS